MRRPRVQMMNANPMLAECPTVQSRLARLWDKSRGHGWALRDMANTIKQPAAAVLQALHQLRADGQVKLSAGRWWWVGGEVQA